LSSSYEKGTAKSLPQSLKKNSLKAYKKDKFWMVRACHMQDEEKELLNQGIRVKLPGNKTN